MLNQTDNKVFIEGVLSEIDIETTKFNKKTESGPVETEAIGGSIKIKVQQDINGETVTLEIPVHMFASKYTNQGKLNPAYESIEKVMKTFNSIAAVGEEQADWVRVNVSSGAIQMNEYYNQNGQLVSFPRINSSFVNKIKREDGKNVATFDMNIFIKNIYEEVDRDGVATGRQVIEGAVVQYGGKVDLVKFFTLNENVTNSILNYWRVNDTVRAIGKLNFSSRTETIVEQVGFGEPVEKTRTINVSELLINGGSDIPFEGEFALDAAEIEEGLKKRVERIEATKEKDVIRKNTTPAPAQNVSREELGF